LKLSTNPFCHWAPGSIWHVSTCFSAKYAFKASAMNFGPMAEHRCAGRPCFWKSRFNSPITPSEVMLRETSITRHSLVCSSRTGMN
jgi:hypothetical protein